MVFSYKNRNFIHKSYHDFKILNSSKDKYMFPYCTTDAKHHVQFFIHKTIDHIKMHISEIACQSPSVPNEITEARCSEVNWSMHGLNLSVIIIIWLDSFSFNG